MSIRTALRWCLQVLRKDKLLISYDVDPETMTFTETLYIRNMSKAQVYGLGYVRAKKMKDELRYLPFKTYVRFPGAASPSFPAVMHDPETGEAYEIAETSSTLYDRYKSTANEQFVKGMTTKTTLSGGDQKKLIMIVAIVAAAAIGLAYIVFVAGGV